MWDRFSRSCWRKVSRSVMWRLYPNGMVYDKWNDFVGLLFNLVMNKTIELKLQRIDHLGRPAHCTVFGQGLRHPDGVGEQRHAQHAFKLIPFAAQGLENGNASGRATAAARLRASAYRRGYGLNNPAPCPEWHRPALSSFQGLLNRKA